MRAMEIIRKKRDGGELTTVEIDAFVRGAIDGSWQDSQLAAMLMAIVLKGMTAAETAHLTYAIAHDGTTFNWDDVPGKKVDKHSSGGVGDKTTMILGPLAGACGVRIPKMSGRGLGHSGGTLDKLESIPGFRTSIPVDAFRQGLQSVGVVLGGQIENVAPADKKLYKLRDVTATVESIPLLTSSILGKKLAEGLDGLVLDVKYGRGAFMQTLEGARELADMLMAVNRANGLPTTVILSGMDAPLGRAIGNALEVVESVETLRGNGPRDLHELSVHLAAHMVLRAGLAESLDAALEQVETALRSGAGLQKFREIIANQGGDPQIVDDLSRLPQAKEVVELTAPRSGYLQRMDAEKLGFAAVRLGAGRDRDGDSIDPAVGFVLKAKPGEYLHAGQPWIAVHFNDSRRLESARELLDAAVEFGPTSVTIPPIIAEIRMG
ncbi:thymidine phosphorylase [Tuwongella immobilis]|uniref:thymidine phosphorylase n=1 Tax=Tuwongella immobilis TaxID=692036 RepID=A0A6C2YLX7_9BACT|nr:thymidine phosphorylase [Tuwongella immobilis]VIP02374.1 pyrimidine-nucleoside phosphorylase : Pyrimidine-nucleoside phosphorylase OS=Thermobacillus composti (strain DSM 18247 / JCM 13945 / KWC4) GN=Theco_1935 PE=4 SV=1: Glycos_trans_3N: Glycos_transf_3: PYNP_C [Tuwongella immobilis]VTS01208.1 pyrimidine-nucleoside phosphorylase : Pyrimidine-nucleoside phosphorylase OS=Thermobacillus composti (strain DSM 18247 / JCM 13945 / KWC4) GN=Theco_1935 PE=4 SV=1: Glycos_trans_3N: Glycos_transf_3: PYNP_